ncbi:BUD32 family EKC/KEOPS complex subunit [Xinfangfangia pollutisoli]|uniref:serine/threonine protein phosphatase n=1 Tax=Xinfangfangia pollutisoli TaxID=2865960 RepID=UPI001CD733A9|nr:serine/threonine protein phosphatase [Xinfangfangia pollutisoli]
MTETTQPSLTKAVADALRGPMRRVHPVDLPDGRRFWLKRVERMGLVLRLQKGDPQERFEAERQGLHVLAEKGMPVVPVVMEGPDFLVTPDIGQALTLMDKADPAEAARAFAAAGKSLALLHWAGLVHGRPAVRDICWDGREARFIDLERFKPGRRGGFWQAMDVVIFTQSCFVRWPGETRLLDAALAAYAANAPDGAMERVARVSRGLWWLAALAALARIFRPNSRDLRAVPQTRRHLGQDGLG